MKIKPMISHSMKSITAITIIDNSLLKQDVMMFVSIMIMMMGNELIIKNKLDNKGNVKILNLLSTKYHILKSMLID